MRFVCIFVNLSLNDIIFRGWLGNDDPSGHGFRRDANVHACDVTAGSEFARAHGPSHQLGGPNPSDMPGVGM